MKKGIILTIILLSFMGFTRAQVSYGITAGATLGSYKVKIQDVSVTSKLRAGFTAGLISSFSLSKDFSLQPCLNFTQKGGILKDDGSNTTEKATYSYLELPINFVYNKPSPRGKFFIGAGPSLSYGLFGKYKITGMYQESGDIKFGAGPNDDLKPFEVGVNLSAGYEFKEGFLIAANYNFGINNVSNDNEGSLLNRYFAIRLGYMFTK